MTESNYSSRGSGNSTVAEKRYEKQLDLLWGPEMPSVITAEERATVFQQLYYGWIGDFINKAVREEITESELPPPTRDLHTYNVGRKLSREVRNDVQRKHSWDPYLGSEVYYRGEPETLGYLRWIGYLRQSDRPHSLLAGVEWEIPPLHRRSGENTELLHDGVVHGEKLFQPKKRCRSSCEPVEMIILMVEYGNSNQSNNRSNNNNNNMVTTGVSPASSTKIPTPVAPNVLWSLVKAHGYHLWVQIPNKLLADLCSAITPVILEQYVAYLEADNTSWSEGIALVLAVFIISTVQSCAAHKYDHMSIRAASIFENSALAVLFEKCLTISEKSLILPEMSIGRIMNMASSDVSNIGDLNWYVIYFLSSPLLLLVSVLLLYRLVGWSAFAGISVLFITFPVQGIFSRWQSSIRKRMATIVDNRIRATNELFSGIRIVKYMTWEPHFLSEIEQAREKEVECLKYIQYTEVGLSLLNGATPTLVIAVVFLSYYLSGHELTPTVVFPTIALLNILRIPFYMIPVIISALLQCLVSARRLTIFLECEENNSSVHNVLRMFSSGVSAAFDDVTVSTFTPKSLPNCHSRIVGTIRKIFALLRSRKFPEDEWTLVQPNDVTTAATNNIHNHKNSNNNNKDYEEEQEEEEEEEKEKKDDEDADFHQLLPKELLKDVNLVIPEGKLTVVVGKTGSGKTTLLSTLLGEYEVTHGRVWATRSIAYVPQQPWIMNATLRENVLFFAPEDTKRLQDAVRVCQLEMDLQLLASGLETEIGEKGINLSGGQRARVSLARAVYADRELYLLDDPLSALDAHVGERVMTDVLLGCLAHKTRVLATHQLHVLSKVDHVILLGDHTVRFSGSRDDFLNSAFYEEISLHEREHHQEEPNEHNKRQKETQGREGADEKEVEEENGKEEEKEKENKEELDDRLDDDPAKKKIQPVVGQQDDNANGKLMTVEEKAVGSVPWSIYLAYFRSCGGIHTAVAVLLVFLFTELLTLSCNVWLSMWSTRHFELSTDSYLHIYIALVILGTVTVPLRFSVGYGAMRRGSRNLHRLILRSVSVGTMEFFDTTPLGRIINRFSRDIDRIDDALQMTIIFLLQSSYTIFSSLAVSVESQPYILVIVIPLAYIYYRLMLFYNASNREIRRVGSTVKAPMLSLLGEVLVGSSTIAAFRCAPSIMREALHRIDLVYAASFVENATNRWLGVRVDFLSNVIVVVIAFVGVVGKVMQLGSHDIGLVSLSLTMALASTSLLSSLVRMVGSMEADMNSVERIIYYTDNIDHEDMPEIPQLVDEIQERKQHVRDATATVVIENDNGTNGREKKNGTGTDVQAGWMEFRDVEMRYRPGLPLVLNKVNFRIEPREKVGIVGRTGSGKSTLLLTFMRMVDICGGDIIVCGRPIRAYGLRELRGLFSMIPQDPVLFDGTVRSNVDPFLAAGAAEVWAALELVGLRARVAAEAGGIDSHVREGGANYSVGQRQLLCLARALLKRGSSFILMDEATANIDHALDRQIQHTVMTAFAAHTVITIAHRLHTVAPYDKIIVMDRGVVVEIGSPRDLVADASSRFSAMVRALGPEETARFMASVGHTRRPMTDVVLKTS